MGTLAVSQILLPFRETKANQYVTLNNLEDPSDLTLPINVSQPCSCGWSHSLHLSFSLCPLSCPLIYLPWSGLQRQGKKKKKRLEEILRGRVVPIIEGNQREAQ